VDPHENGLARPGLSGLIDIPGDERDMFRTAHAGPVGDRGEGAMVGGYAAFCPAMDQLFHAAAVPNQVGDGDGCQTMLRGEGKQVGPSRHRAVLVGDLTQHASRSEARQSAQIDSTLGVASAAQYPAVARDQRKDVPRPRKLRRLRVWVDQGTDRPRTVGRRNARRRRLLQIHRDCERGAAGIIAIGNHGRQLQCFRPMPIDGHAHQAAGVANEERKRLGRRMFRRHDEIPLVLAILVVDDHNHPPLAQVMKRSRDRSERRRRMNHEVKVGLNHA